MRVGPQRISPQVLAALSRVPQVKKQVRLVAAEIRTEARRLAPKDTGALRRGIAVDNVLDARGAVEFRVGWTPGVFYGPLVEFGTEDTLPQPHLRPAALKVKGSGGGRR